MFETLYELVPSGGKKVQSELRLIPLSPPPALLCVLAVSRLAGVCGATGVRLVWRAAGGDRSSNDVGRSGSAEREGGVRAGRGSRQEEEASLPGESLHVSDRQMMISLICLLWMI